MRFLDVTVLSLAFLPGWVMAGVQGESQGERQQMLAQQIQQRFVAADKNGDGQLSREEAAAGMPRVSRHFDAIDVDGNGSITRDELKAFFKQKAGDRPGAGM